MGITGWGGEFTAAASGDGHASPRGNLVVPLIGGNIVGYNGNKTLSVNQAALNLYRIPISGTLKGVFIANGATAGGNYKGLVFDTHDPAELLWVGASTASAASQRIDLGNPDIAVTAGQYIYMGLLVDHSTQNHLARSGANAWSQLPSIDALNGVDETTILPKLAWHWTAGTFSPSVGATVTEANKSASTSNISGVFAYVLPS